MTEIRESIFVTGRSTYGIPECRRAPLATRKASCRAASCARKVDGIKMSGGHLGESQARESNYSRPGGPGTRTHTHTQRQTLGHSDRHRSTCGRTHGPGRALRTKPTTADTLPPRRDTHQRIQGCRLPTRSSSVLVAAAVAAAAEACASSSAARAAAAACLASACRLQQEAAWRRQHGSWYWYWHQVRPPS